MRYLDQAFMTMPEIEPRRDGACRREREHGFRIARFPRYRSRAARAFSLAAVLAICGGPLATWEAQAGEKISFSHEGSTDPRRELFRLSRSGWRGASGGAAFRRSRRRPR
jgi:hypothetical protein